MPLNIVRGLTRPGSEDEQAINDRVVKRVNAEMIARQKEAPVLTIVNHKRKLSIDLVEEVDAVLFVQMKQDFDIRTGAEVMSFLHQRFLQLDVVEDFAIAEQHHGTVFVVDRLVATLQIDDAQTPEA
jgi:isopentenyldiphosphate isomerase